MLNLQWRIILDEKVRKVHQYEIRPWWVRNSRNAFCFFTSLPGLCCLGRPWWTIRSPLEKFQLSLPSMSAQVWLHNKSKKLLPTRLSLEKHIVTCYSGWNKCSGLPVHIGQRQCHESSESAGNVFNKSSEAKCAGRFLPRKLARNCTPSSSCLSPWL